MTIPLEAGVTAHDLLPMTIPLEAGVTAHDYTAHDDPTHDDPTVGWRRGTRLNVQDPQNNTRNTRAPLSKTMTIALNTRTVNVQSGAVEIPAYLAEPSGTGPFPVVVVIQEVFGVNAHIREVTERLAREGYVAIAPAIYHRQVANFDVGYGPADLELGRKYKMGTQAAELLNDIQGCIDYAQGMSTAKSGGVGCIGFCFGGHVAYLAATLPGVAATASFYGAGITTLTPGGGAPTVTLTPAIPGVIYGFFGQVDPLIPNEQVDEIEAMLQTHNIRHRVFRYAGAGHGFFCDRRDSYQPQAAEAAWTQVKQLFLENL